MECKQKDRKKERSKKKSGPQLVRITQVVKHVYVVVVVAFLHFNSNNNKKLHLLPIIYNLHVFQSFES